MWQVERATVRAVTWQWPSDSDGLGLLTAGRPTQLAGWLLKLSSTMVTVLRAPAKAQGREDRAWARGRDSEFSLQRCRRQNTGPKMSPPKPLKRGSSSIARCTLSGRVPVWQMSFRDSFISKGAAAVNPTYQGLEPGPPGIPAWTRNGSTRPGPGPPDCP